MLTNRLLFRGALLVSLSVSCASVVLGQSVRSLVDLVDQASYRNYLDNRLYTRMGHNRGNGAQHDLARDFIKSEFESFGLQTTLDPFTYSGRTYHNVVAFKPGYKRPNQYYVVGAHFDSANNPGADDNASGTAGVLEMARVMSRFRFEASVYFIAFDREEQGLIGSNDFATKNRTKDIRGMVSLDMIAYNAGGANQASIYGRTQSNGVKSGLAGALQRYGNIASTLSGQLDASDHAPFEWQGFAAALLIERNYNGNPHYHRSTDSVDTPNYIDYAYATNMTRGALGFFATEARLLPTPYATEYEVVPEPGTLVVLAIGAALAIRRRR